MLLPFPSINHRLITLQPPPTRQPQRNMYRPYRVTQSRNKTILSISPGVCTMFTILFHVYSPPPAVCLSTPQITVLPQHSRAIKQQYYQQSSILPGIFATPRSTASWTALIPMPSTVRPSSPLPLSSLPLPLLKRRRLSLLLLRPAHSPPSSREYRPVLQIFAPVEESLGGWFDVGKLPKREAVTPPGPATSEVG